MSTQYTPDTDSVRACYLSTHTDASGERVRDEAARSFDRWLNEVKAQAWNEGQRSQAEAHGTYIYTGPNPYRKEN